MDFLKGTGVALATPFDENLSIDFEALEKLINHVSKGKVEYLVVLGTTGESPTVSWEEKLEILEFVSKNNSHSLPIAFGLGGNNTSELVSKVMQIKDYSIDAILSASPYYNKPSQKGLISHYEMLASASDFPLILYNVPSRTSSNIEADTTLKLAMHPNIAAIKEASGDLRQCSRIAANKPEDFILLSGEDLLTLPIMSVGGEGVISVTANYIPEKFSNMVRAALKGEYQYAKELHLSMLEVYNLMNLEGNPASVKAGLHSLGIMNKRTRLPLSEASEELVKSFEKIK